MAHIYVKIIIYMSLIFFLQFYGKEKKRIKIIRWLSVLLVIIISYEFSQRDYYIGTDTENYRYIYNYIGTDIKRVLGERDIFFYLYIHALSYITDFRGFLFITSCLYMGLPLIATNILYKKDFYLFFILFLISPYFIIFGINGLRNGLAASILIFSFAWYVKSEKKSMVLSVISCLVHTSMLLPAFVFWIIRDRISSKKVFIIWLLVFLFSLVGMSFIPYLHFFVSDGYLIRTSNTSGFRDFLIYGLPILLAGLYFAIRNNQDVFYTRILNTYILGSMLQVVTMNFPFGVRFAYLAGFLMPIVAFMGFYKNIKRNTRILLLLCLYGVFMIKAYKILFYY